MIYLLDINVLLAMSYLEHVHHARVEGWLETLKGDDTYLTTCSITELGFIRVASGPSKLAESLATAQQYLSHLKIDWNLLFLADPLGADRLPDWVHLSKQTTDGHLVELATTHGARFATLDEGVPSAVLIPLWPVTPGVSEESPAYGRVA